MCSIKAVSDFLGLLCKTKKGPVLCFTSLFVSIPSVENEFFIGYYHPLTTWGRGLRSLSGFSARARSVNASKQQAWKGWKNLRPPESRRNAMRMHASMKSREQRVVPMSLLTLQVASLVCRYPLCHTQISGAPKLGREIITKYARIKSHIYDDYWYRNECHNINI